MNVLPEHYNEYLKAADPETYTDEVLATMSEEVKYNIIDELEYNYYLQNHGLNESEIDYYKRNP